MTRKQRLQSASKWLAEYEGGNVIRSYRKHYAVDWVCAIAELRLLGVQLDAEYVGQLQRTVQEQLRKNRRKRLEKKWKAATSEWVGQHQYSDETHYFIAGHTSNGVPYGLTWEEARKQGLMKRDEPYERSDISKLGLGQKE